MLRGAWSLFLRAMVVVMPFLLLAGDRAATLRAREPTDEWEIMVSLSLYLSPVLHHLLALVEQLTTYEWLERS